MAEKELTEEEKAKKQAEKEGRRFADLTEDEKAALARDYDGERDVLNAEYQYAEGEMDLAGPEGRSAGNTYVAANPLEHLATALRKRRGKKERATAKEGLAATSKARQLGTRAAMDVARNDAAQREAFQRKMLEKWSGGRGADNPASAATPLPPQAAPMQSAANPPPSLAAPQRPQMPSGGNVPGNPAEWMNYMAGAEMTTPNADAIRRKKKEEEQRMSGMMRGF